MEILIGLLILALAFLAFVRQTWLYFQYKQYQGRRGLMGCEIARQVLDLSGHSQAAVQSLQPGGQGMFQDVKKLLLTEKIYHGRSLFATAQSACQAVRMTRLPDAGGMAFRVRLFLEALILPAWAAVFAGTAFPAAAFLKWPGELILGSVFFIGALDLGRDFEITREAYELLKKTDCFEKDELVKLKYLLEAAQWENAAKIFKVPFEIVSYMFEKMRGRDAV